jgi:hypothetical protein
LQKTKKEVLKMAVQLNGKATERQRKYLGYLSSQGKERFGKDFSVRKIAEQQGINWEQMSSEEASKLIEYVKSLVDAPGDFMKTDQDIIDEVTRAAQEEAQKEEKPGQGQTQAQASSSKDIYMIQIIVHESKIPAVTIVLEAMGIGYVLLQEVRP